MRSALARCSRSPIRLYERFPASEPSQSMVARLRNQVDYDRWHGTAQYWLTHHAITPRSERFRGTTLPWSKADVMAEEVKSFEVRMGQYLFKRIPKLSLDSQSCAALRHTL